MQTTNVEKIASRLATTADTIQSFLGDISRLDNLQLLDIQAKLQPLVYMSSKAALKFYKEMSIEINQPQEKPRQKKQRDYGVH